MASLAVKGSSGKWSIVPISKMLMWTGIAIAIIILTIWLAKTVPNIGQEKTETSISLEKQPLKLLGLAFNIGGTTTIEILVILLAIFLIMFVAISDILQMFSTFSTPIAWIIGFALALIASFSGIVNQIAVIFGLTAGLGAIGIGIIILGSLFSAVTLNLGVGGAIRTWRIERQNEITAFKGSKGRQIMAEGARTFKMMGKETTEGEKA